jgi:hypothetical protein
LSASARFVAGGAFVLVAPVLPAAGTAFFRAAVAPPVAGVGFRRVAGAVPPDFAADPDAFLAVSFTAAGALAAFGVSADAFFAVTRALLTAVAAFFFATMAATPSHIVILLANRSGTINRLWTRGNGARRLIRPPGPVGRPVCIRCAQLTARYAGKYR